MNIEQFILFFLLILSTRLELYLLEKKEDGAVNTYIAHEGSL